MAARTAQIQTNFTAGELSPRLKGRVDINKYGNGCEELYNFVAQVHGGARRRDGLRFAHEVKTSAKKARLIPFVFSRAQAYMLEFGDQTMRVNKDGGRVESSPGVPYEIATPYLDTELANVHYIGLADTMFLFHPSYPTRKLTRSGHAAWKMVPVPWLVEPFAEQGYKPATTLTLGATSGAGVAATAGAASFREADVGREIIAGDGVATIVAFTSTTVVTVDIRDAFAAVGPIASGSWAITLSPVTTLTPSASGLGAAVDLTATANAWQDNAQVSHVGMYVQVNDGVVFIESITSALIAHGTIKSELSSVSAASSGSWTLEQKVWTAANGYPRCGTLYEQRLYAAGSTQYPQTIWGSKTGQFFNMTPGSRDEDGVNFTIASNEVNQIEHLAAGADLLPLTYGGEFRMFGGSDNPITPGNVRIKSQSAWGVSTVRPVRVGNDFIYATASGKKIRSMGYEFASDRYVSSDVLLLSEHLTSTYDPHSPAPVAGAWTYPDATIVALAYQQDPDSRLWAARSDGLFLPCAFQTEQQVVGWSRCQTLGLVEDIATIPYGTATQVWMIIKRGSKRFVEYLDPLLNTDCAVTGSVGSVASGAVLWGDGQGYVTKVAHGRANGDRVKLEGFAPSGWNVTRTLTVVDADTFTISIEENPGPATTLGTLRYGSSTWSGFSHLVGETLDVVGDGVRLNTQVVSGGGTIATERPVFDLEGGLHYTSRLKLLPIESQAFGTAQGRMVSVYEVVVRVRNTRGLQIDGKEVAFLQHGENVHDNAAPAFSGDKVLEKLIWERSGGALTIEQPYPLPCEITSIVRKIAVNE